MLCLGDTMGEDHEIIHIDDQKPLMHLVTKDVVHHLLERAGTIAHAKIHDDRFVRANRCDEYTFSLIASFDTHVVVSSMEVHLSVHITSLELIDQLQYERQRVIVADGAFARHGPGQNIRLSRCAAELVS